MKRFGYVFAFLFTIALFNIPLTYAEVDDMNIEYPETEKIPIAETIHGVEIVDNYRWLEDGADPGVREWEDRQMDITTSILDRLPQREFLINRFNQLWRYDGEGLPISVPDSDRIFFWAQGEDEEKQAYFVKDGYDGTPRKLIDPNEWDEVEALSGFYPSRDGKYVAFGKTVGGDENPIMYVMDVDTGEILPDSLQGRKQMYASWLPENKGFYYFAKPQPGEVPEGEENYWTTAYYHKLGTGSEKDIKVFYHDEVKEYFHYVSVSEDGKYAVFYRTMFNANEVFFRRLDTDGELSELVTGFDAEYGVDIIDDRIYIVTDSEAPMFKAYITDVDKPDREHWREFIPEDKAARLNYIVPAAGRIYAVYEEKAHTVIKVFDGDGDYLRDVALPILGSAAVRGLWSKPEVWVNFTSFTYPRTYFRYEFDNDALTEYWRYPIAVDVDSFTADQVWYNSKDGTPVSMFLIYRKNLERNGSNPVLLNGYGGFNNSITPYFSGLNVAWLEAGGMIAKPNLRGGGEYGREWHEGGMCENKQNVFDDFIAAAEWLIANDYTNSDKLAIDGGSNGGLLVGAVTVQRPGLFAAVNCTIPLLDMIRFHKFDFANVWTEEYGSPDNPDDFEYIYKYSPYHNVVDGVDYPAIMITASENDARVNPLHARKMVARMQEADPDGKPILYRIQRDSGHGYGTTLSTLIEQFAEEYAFLMDRLGMEAPK